MVSSQAVDKVWVYGLFLLPNRAQFALVEERTAYPSLVAISEVLLASSISPLSFYTIVIEIHKITDYLGTPLLTVLLIRLPRVQNC